MENTIEERNLESRNESIQQQMAGFVAISAAVLISLFTVILGEKLVYGQLTNSILPGGLSIITGVLMAIVVISSMIVALFTISGIINKFATPTINNKAEYTLYGVGGGIGTFIGVLYWMIVRTIPEVTTVSMLIHPTGESIIALTLVAAPVSIVFHEFYSPDTSPRTPKDDELDFDPEFVKKQTAKKSTTHEPTLQDRIKEKQSENTTNTTKHTNQNSQKEESKHGSVDADGKGIKDMEYRWVTETNVSFKNIGGMSELKSELNRDVIKPLTTHREKAESLGISAPNIIFHGPPGTGKTFIAKGLATELGLPFVKLSGADIQSKWINESSQKVKKLFDEARQMAEQNGGAVVFLDELDSVLKNRGGSGSHEEDNKVVNEFLNHLEGTEDHNVVFIGATNRLESIDQAGMRSGRIDKKVFIGKPDAEARKKILEVQLEERPNNVTVGELEEVAKKTSGLVAADLELVVKDGAKRVLGRDGDKITVEDLEAVISSV